MQNITVKEEHSPYIFSFPHSGQRLTDEMERKLLAEAKEFLPNCDWHLNELFAFLNNYKVNIISTPYSRYLIDVNRPPSAEKLGNYRRSLVYSTNTWDEEIYAKLPIQEEIDYRIQCYYEPYHEKLQSLVDKKIKEFGKVYLIDIHSFMGPITQEVCLGNRYNATSSEAFIDRFYEAFESENFEVVKNNVFIGGHITKSYTVENMVETLQIELRYTNYIEEHELDVRSVPSKDSKLFCEMAVRLERVMMGMGILT